MSGPAAPSTLTVEIVDGALTRDLRRRVLRPEQSPEQPIPTDGDASVVHLAAVVEGLVVGACALRPEPCPWLPEVHPAWRLRGMATDPDQRGQGLGRALLMRVESLLAQWGAGLVWCHARLVAEAFYTAHGWQGHGEIFTEHALPHRAMYRPISPLGGPAER